MRERMMDEVVEVTEQVRLEMVRMAAQRARDRASAARWDLDVAIFAFAVLSIIVILLFQGIGIEIMSLAAAAGLAMVWLAGWSRARKLYERFYDEELSILEQEFKRTVKGMVEETIEEKVQKALRKR